MRKKLLSSILVITMAANLLTGCGSGKDSDTVSKEEASQEEGVIDKDTEPTQTEESADSNGEEITLHVRTYWSEGSLPNWASAIEKYESEHPGIRVELEYSPAGTDTMSKLRAEFLSGDTPDVVQCPKTYFNEFVDSGLVENLNKEYEENGWVSGEVLVNGSRNWDAPLTEATNPDADVYGVADYINNSVIFYNTGIFEELGLAEPSTLDELLDCSKKLKDAGYKPMVAPGASGNIVDLLAAVQVQITGVQYLLDVNDGKAKLTDEPMQQAMAIIEKMIKEGVVDKSSLTYSEEDAISEFVSGKAAMYKMHTANNTTLMQASEANPDFHYSIMKGIKFVDNPVTETSCTYGGCWIVPTTSKHAEEAKDFLFYIFGPEVSEGSATEGRRITNMIQANSVLTDPAMKVVLDYQLPGLTNDSFYLLDMLSGTGLSALASGLQGMLEGTMTGTEALEQAQRLVEESSEE